MLFAICSLVSLTNPHSFLSIPSVIFNHAFKEIFECLLGPRDKVMNHKVSVLAGRIKLLNIHTDTYIIHTFIHMHIKLIYNCK